MEKRISFFHHIFAAVLFFLLIIPSVAQKQTKTDLENKVKQTQEEIEYTKQQLNETKHIKKISLTQLLLVNKKISSREQLIATISSQIAYTNAQINVNNKALTTLQDELKKLKDEYAKMIYNAYKNRDSYNKLMFVFASSNFDQAFLRLKYFQQYNEYRKRQAEQIILKQSQIGDKIKELEVQVNDKRHLLGIQETEKETLTKEKGEKEEVLTALQSKEKQLKEDLNKKKKDAAKLQQAIERIIKEEIEKSTRLSTEKGTKKALSLVLTPEAQKLSSSFASNKGKLPWPVIQGVIVDKFGVHPHPSLSNVEINNNGVDIATSKAALARAVFDGEVTGIVNIPSSGKVIIIRHGEYLSVYSNMNEVYVKTGDKIKTKQNIGNIIFNEEEAKTELHVEIWKGQTKLNPEDWLFNKN